MLKRWPTLSNPPTLRYISSLWSGHRTGLGIDLVLAGPLWLDQAGRGANDKAVRGKLARCDRVADMHAEDCLCMFVFVSVSS